MNKNNLINKIKQAKGEVLSDLVLKDCKIINVFTNEIIKGDIAIYKDTIVGIGEYNGKNEIDLQGKLVSPGFIDSHVHIESSMLSPAEFSKIVLSKGVTSVIADPHEIANICGSKGIEYILNENESTPLDIYMVLPSCVPATNFETSGARLGSKDLKKLMNNQNIIGLGEMMNYPGVICEDEDIVDKLYLFKDHIIDGHAPGVKGKDLNAYIVSGINTDHEASNIEEALEKIRLGMYILIREGSAAKDLKNLIGAVNKDNLSRFMFCTDDKHPKDLLNEGSINFNIKLAIEQGIDPIDAIKLATINVANAYGLKGIGAIAPGYIGDLVIFDNFDDFNIDMVFKSGTKVYEKENILFETLNITPKELLDTVKIGSLDSLDLSIFLKGDKANIINLNSNSLITNKSIEKVNTFNNKYINTKGVSKLAVIERHKASGNVGLGLVKNFNIKNGAIGTTIGHDSHNLIVIGDNDDDMFKVIEEIEKNKGGIVLVQNGSILESVSLEIGGIMTSKSIYDINDKFDNMIDLAYRKLEINEDIDPFMTLSFLALPVIPSIKLTDKGLFDVEEFKFIDISVD